VINRLALYGKPVDTTKMDEFKRVRFVENMRLKFDRTCLANVT